MEENKLSQATNTGLNKTYEALLKERSQVKEKDLKYFQKRARELGATKVFSINPREDIIFQERVRVACANNCFHYGVKLSCPPYIPDLDYEKAIKEYREGLIVLVNREIKDFKDFERKRTESTNTIHGILLKLEGEAFNRGYYLTTSFIGGSCKLCLECDETCKYPKSSRIPVEATGINIIKTLEKFDIYLRFPVEKHKKFSRVGLLLPGK